MKKSLYTEIRELVEQYLEDIDTDKHFNEGSFESQRSAVKYAMNNILGRIKVKKWELDNKKISENRKKKKSNQKEGNG